MDRSARAERRAEPRAVARRRRRQRVLCATLLVLSTVLAGLGLARSQHHARSGLLQRWDARTQLSAEFVQTYVDQLFDREEQVAEASFASSSDGVDQMAHAFGFSDALLLDSRGAVLAGYPEAPALLGRNLAAGYPHLRSALAGTRTVSPVVAAAADGQPVVGFALPFPTLSGRRVFNGAYSVDRTPLSAYLQRMTPVKGAGIYLVDASGAVVTSSLPVHGVRQLRELEPALARAAAGRSSGTLRTGGTDQYFATYPVRGTPWRLVARAPLAGLLVSVRGASHDAPWLLLGTAALVGLLALWLWFRRLDTHDDLRRAYARLDRLANLDGLTELPNRRSTRAALEAAHADRRTAAGWLSVLMVDVDHFKRINDTFGHAAGDSALLAVADRLRLALREPDAVGRWGGEEFLVVLPGADPELAATLAERLRAAVADAPVEVGTGGDAIDVRISVGAASSRHAGVDALVHTADRALYAAKAAGRDRVRALST